MKKCDLILLSWNHLELTKPCVESILKNTHIPSNLIIVDNGSNKETRDYLKTIKGNGTIDVEILYNERNEGFVGGMNKGMRHSSASFVCLLNNDIVVTDSWLSPMIGLAENYEDIGIVNPCSNTTHAGATSPEGLNEFMQNRPVQSGFSEMGAAVGFCMLIKREVINKIGYLAEDLNRFSYEDTGYSLRAKMAGYRCVMAKGAYIFHHTEGTIGKIKGHKRIYKENQAKFEAKWGKALRIFFVTPYNLYSEYNLFKRDLEKAYNLVGLNNFVYFVYRDRKKIGYSSLFQRFNVIEHGNIYLIPFAAWPNLFDFFCLFRIIKRSKKRYNVILIRASLQSIVKKLRFIHKAEVFDINYNFDQGYLWKKRFLYR
ncbi:MAG: glycosyltransferase family 2 protein [Candidatus Omnitrophota bacterium]|nr:MAG: glycosyltransferase family 2 protein [Candidatus Omnitrophota bacterium]